MNDMASAADLYTTWTMSPPLWAGVAAIALLASYVALDLVQRVPSSTGRSRMVWLLGSALALGTGTWAVHFIGLAGESLTNGVGYGGSCTLLGWLCVVAASAMSLRLGVGARGRPARWLAAGAALGLGVLGSEFMYFRDMRMAPALVWHPAWAIATVLAAGLGATMVYALGLLFQPGAIGRIRQAASATLLALALVLAHRASAFAAQVPFDSVSLNQLVGISSSTLGLMAGLAASALLAVLLLLSIVESRMRRALRRAIVRIEEAAHTDALTGLPNRLSFDRSIDTAASDAMALLMFGLDGFKSVNDAFGRSVGDLLLQEMARRLRAAARPGDVVARVGGDEFALLMTGGVDRDAAAQMARRLLAAVGETCDLEGRQTVVSCSIGMVLYPEHGGRSTLMVYAEAAARAVKSTGGASYTFFEPQMLGGARDQLELLRDLRLALVNGQLELYYQPKIHAASGEITGAEALMRWHHPQRGMVGPGVFVPIAERYGLISAMGNWVIEEACRQIRDWRAQGVRMRVAVNLSVHQLRQPDLAERIAAALQSNHVNPELLTCEITESVAMADAQGTAEAFAKLAAVGVHISIDDFGTGYSSLSYLRNLPAEELKIDRSFVLDLASSKDARAVVEAVIKLAQALSLKVVAEGVEAEAQYEILRSLGCDELQGFLFAKPMSAKALALWAMDDVGPSELAFRDSLFTDTMPAAAH